MTFDWSLYLKIHYKYLRCWQYSEINMNFELLDQTFHRTNSKLDSKVKLYIVLTSFTCILQLKIGSFFEIIAHKAILL